MGDAKWQNVFGWVTRPTAAERTQPIPRSPWKLPFALVMLVCSGVPATVVYGQSGGLLSVVPDGNALVLPGYSGSTNNGGQGSPGQGDSSSINLWKNGLSESIRESHILDLVQRRTTTKKQFEQEVQEEELLMKDWVRIMDRSAAANWMASFISSPPLSCPRKQQAQWIDAILYSVENNGLPISKEILALVASIISIESGFRVDPLAVDPSRGEDIARMLERAENDLYAKFGKLLSMPPLPQLYRAYRDRYYPRLLECQTEGQIEVVAQDMAEDLKRDVGLLPGFLKSIVVKEIDKLIMVVRTKGSMQLNFPRARQVMKERGELFTDRELSDYMYTLNGGVDVGVAALKPMFVQYAAHYAAEGSLSWLFFVGMDYNYGPFSSRNMMEQIRIRDLSGKEIAIDGDLMHYDDKARPQLRDSETMNAALSMLPSMPKSAFINAFVLEKDPHYRYTDIHELITAAHRNRFGETPFAVIGELWMGENARIKHGTTWKTQAYLNKLDKYLNSIPWDP